MVDHQAIIYTYNTSTTATYTANSLTSELANVRCAVLSALEDALIRAWRVDLTHILLAAERYNSKRRHP